MAGFEGAHSRCISFMMNVGTEGGLRRSSNLVLVSAASEAGEGGMIGREFIHGQLQELFERTPIVDLGFQLGIGIDVEPLLQKQAFQKQEGMVGIVAFRALADGIVSEHQALDPGPVDDTVDFLHSFDGLVPIHRFEKGDVGKGETGHFLEAHISSKGVKLEKIWHKSEEMSSIN